MALNPPSNFSYSSVTQKISWPAVTGADEYIIEINWGNPDVFWQIYSGSDTAFTFVPPAAIASIEVKGKSGKSDEYSEFTNPPETITF